MKAWVLHDIGDIRYEDVDVPVAAPGEVRIRVAAAGICGSDIPRIFETGAHRMPLIPGHEFAGTVVDTGKGVAAFRSGKRVAVFPKIACKKCRMCREGHPELCTDYDYTGSRRDGAFAEYVTVPAENLLELPDSISFEQAAMLEPLAVAANAVRTGCFAVPKTAAVCGAGPIGLAVVMMLKHLGCESVFLIANKDAQKERAGLFGIGDEAFCDSRYKDPSKWLSDVTDGGAEVYFECVGNNESIYYGIEGLAPEGRLVLVGNPASDMSFSRDTYWKILRNRLTLSGIWNSSFSQADQDPEECGDDWHFVLRMIAEGGISPEKLISHRFPLEELDEALGVMKDRKSDRCKVMIVS
ncbi:MAG: galactitol-1-phosphate 5-dehydrogenase [Lachnospiraceae bacterium]|nr:galactitol-1-phosphate 5-dehydrogenase [Lachnospiraceae bacterium]